MVGLTPRRSIELAKAAEANNFSSVWFAENPFNRGVLPAAAACAVATKPLGIGIGVFNPYNRHPTLIAMEIGALDELAQGRARLGIGSGIASAVQRMGLSPELPIGAVRDAITIVRALLKGEEVNHAGRVFSAHKVKLDYAPPRPDMPLLMAARGDRAIALCGEIADGLMISNLCPPDFTAHAAEELRAAAQKAQRPPPSTSSQYVPCAARADRAEAYRLAKESLGEALPGFWSLGAARAGGEGRHCCAPATSPKLISPTRSRGCAPASARRTRSTSASSPPSPSPARPRIAWRRPRSTPGPA